MKQFAFLPIISDVVSLKNRKNDQDMNPKAFFLAMVLITTDS